MRILILGDSLVFPRSRNKIKYEDTWAGILASNGHEIFLRAKGGSNITHVEKELDHLMSYFNVSSDISSHEFDLIILQAGIVDLSPRLFSPSFKNLISKIPFFSKYILLLSRNKVFYKYFGHRSVSEMKFKSILIRLRHKFTLIAKNNLIIEIARPAHFLIQNVGDFSDVVVSYNRIYREIYSANFLEVYDNIDISEIMLMDGHHLNHCGHKLIAQKILEKLSHGNS
jgi:hypothetical protein